MIYFVLFQLVIFLLSQVGVGQIKIKDHLSLADAEIGAELGNKKNKLEFSNEGGGEGVRDGFDHVGARGPGSCCGGFFVCRCIENMLRLSLAKLSHIWP